MSLDRSLKTAGSLVQHRSVLTRAERIAKMKENGEFNGETSPLGLPKFKNIKLVSAKKKKEAKSDENQDETDTAG